METFDTATAPGFAKHSSSFKTDERCYEVHFVVGTDYDSVHRQTRLLAEADKTLIDYDVNYSTEGEAYVGVTCRDY